MSAAFDDRSVGSGCEQEGETYDWRSELPNLLRIRLAPQVYLDVGAQLTPASAERVLREFLEHLVDVRAGSAPPVDMRGVLEWVEQLLPGTSASARRAMVLI